MATSEKITIDEISRTLTALTGAERIAGRDGSGDFKVTLSTFKKFLSIGEIRNAYNESEAAALIAAGWLEFNGQTYSATSYPLLAAARPEWASGGIITIPDESNRVERVKGVNTGAAGTTQEDNVGQHTHRIRVGVGSPGYLAVYRVDSSDGDAAGYVTDYGLSGETRGKTFIVRKFVASDAIFS